MFWYAINCISLLLALGLCFGFVLRQWSDGKWQFQIACGLLFGYFCVVAMIQSQEVGGQGLLANIRAVLIGVGTFFAGPLSGLIATLISIAYRLYSAGSLVPAGIISMLLAIAVGWLSRVWRQTGTAPHHIWGMVLFSSALNAIQWVILAIAAPKGIKSPLLESWGISYFVFFLVITFLLGWVMREVEGAERMHSELTIQEARFRDLLQDLPSVAIQAYDSEGRTTFWNKTSEIMYGFSAREVLGKVMVDIGVQEDRRATVRQQQQDVFRTGKAQTGYETVVTTKDGSELIVYTSRAPIIRNGLVAEVFGFDIDLTFRRKVEAELRVAAAAFETQEGMLVTDKNRVILRINQKFTELTGYAAKDVVGHQPDLISVNPADKVISEAMSAAASSRQAWEGEVLNRQQDGHVVTHWALISAVRDEYGTVVNFVITLTDITRRKADEEQIRRLAFFDSLTGLPNRRMLRDRLEHALAASHRTGNHSALLFIDLDHFKNLNDTLGHALGDQLLEQVAQRLRTNVREGDTVARLGGDEYVVLLESLSVLRDESVAQAKLVGEKLMDVLNTPYHLAGNEFNCGLSMGVTLFDAHVSNIDEVLKQADLAMYQAKAAGRNGIRFFDPQMQAVVTQRAALEADIRQAILQDQYSLFYQAQTNAEGKVIGAEALLRWKHPQRGMVSPATFIPVAEDSGLIVPLGNWVLEAACTQLAAWAKKPMTEHLTLAVNVSSRQFRQPDFADYIIGMFAYTGANPRRLKLELTESMLAENLDDVISKMGALRTLGVGFSLDDFGTGYSSLTYLKRLPLVQLKIDQSFVRDVLTDPNDATIAKTILALGHSLGLNVIAEGVETLEQRQFLLENGCDAFQGYLISRPLDISTFEDFMTTHAKSA